MLSFKEISKYFSSKENQFPQLVLKEYLQYKILDIVFSSKYGDKLVFMGGTAIRLVYGNDRFSEDLDLDNTGLSKKDFDNLVSIIQRELKADGIEVEVRNTFKDVYHCYMKFPRILFGNKLSPLKDEKILIRLDSFYTKEVQTVQPFALSRADIFSEIRVYPASIILSQKIEALFKRKRSKGRDIYDIVYLFGFTKPEYSLLKKSIKIDNEPTLFEKMRELFTERELNTLAKDVEPFLLNSKKVAQVKKFRLWIESFRK